MRQHALPLFDNVGAISPRVADFFCGAATGSGFSARRLFTDDELIVFRYFRPLVITAINPPATSSDFLDRCACFDLRRIQDTHRLREAVVWSEFEQRRPEILGGLLDAAATALRLMGSLQIALLPRMADFAFFGEAYCRALGYAAGRFMEAYWRNIEELAWYAIEASPVAIAAVNFTEHRDVWRGTPTDLRRLLATYSEDHDRGEWPKDAASLSKEIRKLSGALRKVGVDVESLPRTADPHRRERQIQIRWVGSCSARWRNAATEAGHSGQDRGSTADRSARMRRRDLVSRPTKPVLFLPPHGPQGEA
jgi:hypothetical protein